MWVTNKIKIYVYLLENLKICYTEDYMQDNAYAWFT